MANTAKAPNGKNGPRSKPAKASPNGVRKATLPRNACAYVHVEDTSWTVSLDFIPETFPLPKPPA